MTDIKKTYKNYVHGKFVRSESGKVYSIDLKDEKYEIPLTSKKDLRDAVTSSKEGFKNWNQLTMYNRSQILYRLSEMIEGNKDSYISLLQDHGLSKPDSKNDINQAIDTIVWYAGLVDKWEQLTGNLNPVAGEYFNISHQEAIGVTFTLSPNSMSLNELVKSILPALTVGCSVINFSDKNAVIALKLSEDINNSDFPSGSLNLLSGNFENIIDLKSRKSLSDFSSINKIQNFRSIFEEIEVPYPYFGGNEGFDHVLDILEDSVSGFLDRIS